MNKVEIKDLFSGLQKAMAGELGLNRDVISHSGSKGDALENSWIDLLRKYLPSRFSVDKAMVIDYEGNVSDQIDIVIYDNFYTPFVFQQNGFKYIPAEGVYAVFEVKPDLNGNVRQDSYIKYAGKKIASVRNLKRTSVKIINAGCEMRARSLTLILGGILANTCTMQQKTLKKRLTELSGNEQIELGCAVDKFAFVVDYEQGEGEITTEQDTIDTYYNNRSMREIIYSQPENSIFMFVMQLSHYIQQSIGTVPAMDYQKYLSSVNERIDVELYNKKINCEITNEQY